MMELGDFVCVQCGTKQIVYFVRPLGSATILKVRCPKCRRKTKVVLTKAEGEEFIDQISEQIYKCKVCEEVILNPTTLWRTGKWIILLLTCPHWCEVKGKRFIHKNYYTMIHKEHVNRFQGAEEYPIDCIGPSLGGLGFGLPLSALGLFLVIEVFLMIPSIEEMTEPGFGWMIAAEMGMIGGILLIAGISFLVIYFYSWGKSRMKKRKMGFENHFN